ncbi:MAG: hypothetical protein JWO31_4066, partial [Phycisphaerales bacterium]|nr:hypothetical protein [Phycisphaerales bacterium]
MPLYPLTRRALTAALVGSAAAATFVLAADAPSSRPAAK